MSKSTVYLARDALREAPKLFGVKTGVPGLDDLFWIVEIDKETGKIVKRTLGGYPFGGVFNITGVPDTGKSLLVEQFAVVQAHEGWPVVFVTVESPAEYVARGLEIRAKALRIDWSEIEDKIALIDLTMNDALRENVKDLTKLIAETTRMFKPRPAKSVVIDSITGLYEHMEVLARKIVRVLFNTMKTLRVTALFVSQKRSSHEEASAEAAGGLAIAHIVDGTIVLSKKIITQKWESQTYRIPLGGVLRTIRIDGCRLAGHDQNTHVMRIREEGIVEVGPTLAEYIERGWE
ncbi:MAG: KaiC domain-containing protein [Candidatus Njordarchaeales archaeon]